MEKRAKIFNAREGTTLVIIRHVYKSLSIHGWGKCSQARFVTQTLLHIPLRKIKALTCATENTLLFYRFAWLQMSGNSDYGTFVIFMYVEFFLYRYGKIFGFACYKSINKFQQASSYAMYDDSRSSRNSRRKKIQRTTEFFSHHCRRDPETLCSRQKNVEEKKNERLFTLREQFFIQWMTRNSKTIFKFLGN